MTHLAKLLRKIENKQVSLSILSHEEIAAALSTTLRLALSSLDVSMVMLCLFEQDKYLVETRVDLDKAWQMNAQTALSLAVETQIKAKGESRGLADTQSYDWGMLSYLAVPLMLGDGLVYGAIAVCETQTRHWIEREMQILSEIALNASTQLDLQMALKSQRESEKALKSSERLFHHVADSLSDAVIILNEETRIQYCNQATVTIFGYDFSELKDQPIDILTHGTMHASMNQFVLNAFNMPQSQSEWQGIRMMGQHKDGSEIPIELTLDMLNDEENFRFKLLVRDVSRQVMVEDRLQADSTRYLQILDAIPDLVYVKDHGSRIVWANKAFQDFFNTPLEDLLGRIEIEGLDNGNTQKNLNDDYQVFATGKEPVIQEEPIMRYDGVQRDFITTKTPIFDDDGDVTLLVGISSDITKAKNIERYLTDALEQRQDLIQLKSDFVSMVSHEFRTPLSVILSSADILRSYHDRLSAERRDEKLETVQDQVQRLTQLMDDVLLINRGDAKGLPFSPSLHDVNALSHSIIEEISTTYKEAGVRINFVGEGKHPLQNIDDNLFRHILQNLLSNAVKYSKPNSEVDVRLNCSDEHLTLVVADRGIGIPATNQDHLYQTFHRAGNVGTIQGTGLGLAIVKRAVDTHGGSINFRSIENEGTMFIVKLNTNLTGTTEGE